MTSSRAWKRDLGLLVVGGLLGASLLSPAGAHVGSSVGHLWRKHVKPAATKLFYTKSQADGRYLKKTAKATDANKLDGIDSVDLMPGGTLPSGATIRGHYSNMGLADGANYQPASHGISFGYRLASAPAIEKILAGQPSTLTCPGTAADPEAAPGYLCVYETDSQNKRDGSYPHVGFGLSGNATRPTGATVTTQSSNSVAGFFWSRGTWAVTAP